MRAKRLIAFIAIVLRDRRNPGQPMTRSAANRRSRHRPRGPPRRPSPPPSVTIIGAAGCPWRARPRRPQPADEDMGRIVDVIVDRAGAVRAAVIDFGGFLGVGSRKIVVDWNALHFGRIANKSDSITLELTKDQVTAAPEYKEDTPIVVLGASGSLQPLQFDP